MRILCPLTPARLSECVQIKFHRHPCKEQQRRRKELILPHADRQQTIDRQNRIERKRQDQPQNPGPPLIQPVQEKAKHHRHNQYLRKRIESGAARVSA